jgi:hypothetical protein
VDHRPDLGAVENRPRGSPHAAGNAVAVELDRLRRSADRDVVVVAVIERDEHVTMPGDEQVRLAILPVALGAEHLDTAFRAAGGERDFHGRSRLEAQIVEVLDGVGCQRPLGEIAPIFAERQRQRNDQRRALLECLAGDELFRPLAERGQEYDGRLLVVAEILAPQRRDHGRHRRFELGEIALAQIAMPGRTDDQGQAIGLPGKHDRPLARRGRRRGQGGRSGHRHGSARAQHPRCRGRCLRVRGRSRRCSRRERRLGFHGGTGGSAGADCGISMAGGGGFSVAASPARDGGSTTATSAGATSAGDTSADITSAGATSAGAASTGTTSVGATGGESLGDAASAGAGTTSTAGSCAGSRGGDAGSPAAGDVATGAGGLSVAGTASVSGLGSSDADTAGAACVCTSVTILLPLQPDGAAFAPYEFPDFRSP